MRVNATELQIFVIGLFRIVDPQRGEIQPRGRKACAIIGMLAVAPSHALSKSWLIDHLWSDRQPKQACASLRQALREIRVALGKYHYLVSSGSSTIRLDTSDLWLDVANEDYLCDLASGENDEIEFLANIDIRDSEYEHWIRDRRNHFAGRLADLREKARKPNDARRADRVFGPTIVRGVDLGSGQIHQLFAHVLSDLVAKSLSDSASVKVLESVPGSRNARYIRLESKAFEFGTRPGATIVLSDGVDGEVLLNTVRNLDDGAVLDLEQREILKLINEAVDGSIVEFRRMYPILDEGNAAASICLHGIEKLFELRFDDLMDADRLFERAHELQPKAVYLAWRAYLRTFVLGDRPDISREETLEEMKSLMRRALELEPANAHILAMSAFITSMWLLDHETGLDYARCSVRINPANPFGVAYLGVVNSHLGNMEEGYRLTRRAMAISSGGPYQHVLAYAALSAAAYAGKHDEAIRIGEALSDAAPKFGATKRFLSLLYYKTGQLEKSEKTIRQIRKVEPEFSFEMMKEGAYRSQIIRRSELMSNI